MGLRLRAAVSVLLFAGAAAAEVDVEALVADLAGSDAARRSAAYTTLIGAKDPRAIKLIAKVAPTLKVNKCRNVSARMSRVASAS